MQSKILIVDDTPKNIQLAANVLKSEPEYSVLYATNGSDALQILEEKEVHLILLDIMMPEMDGYEVARRVQENPKTSEIPIIFLSANSDAKSIDLGFQAGGSDYLSKPFIANELKNRVKTHLELYHAKNALKSELNKQLALLEQYKEVVDKNSIVSKTDTKGFITYVNDKFCEITGYSRAELIGQPHNIVRCECMPKSFYKEMWDTIKAKRSWNGILRNKRKNGTIYSVDAMVMPILDTNGEIVEYISSRHDVTEIFALKDELAQTQSEVLYTLGELGETRSKETGAHVKRVAELSYLLAKSYGLPEQEAQLLRSASPMHDIGKVAIPDSILLKPGALDSSEWIKMQKHTTYGYEIFRVSQRPLLQAAATISHEHHEKWDGSGYPRALAGEEIHIYGRITALADVFDALRSDRVYKKAWSCEETLSFIREQRGKHFEPKLVDIFFENLQEINTLWEELGESPVL